MFIQYSRVHNYIPEGDVVVAIVEGDWVVIGVKAAIAVVTKNINQFSTHRIEVLEKGSLFKRRSADEKVRNHSVLISW